MGQNQWHKYSQGEQWQGSEVTNRWPWLFHPPAHDTGLQTCNRLTAHTHLWQIIPMFELSGRTMAWNESSAGIKQLSVWIPLIFGGAYITCTYLHLLFLFIAAIITLMPFYFIISSFKSQEFYLHWISYNFNLSSGKKLSRMFSYWVFCWRHEGFSLHRHRACIASLCYGSVVTNTNLSHPPTDLLSLQCSQFPWHDFTSRKSPYIGI